MEKNPRFFSTFYFKLEFRWIWFFLGFLAILILIFFCLLDIIDQGIHFLHVKNEQVVGRKHNKHGPKQARFTTSRNHAYGLEHQSDPQTV